MANNNYIKQIEINGILYDIALSDEALNEIDTSLYSFEIVDGNLILNYTGTTPDYFIDTDGHLKLGTDGTYVDVGRVVPIKGVDYNDGAKGDPGISATHSWNGTTLTITSASGTSSANLKGDKGDKGDTYNLTSSDKNTIATTVKNSMATETWTFILDNGSSITKTIYLQ